jgi:hypothetical protein
MKIRSLAVGACALATACGGGDVGTTTPTPTSVVGTWKVTSVNSQPLPYTIRQDASGRITMLSGTVVFGGDGKWTEDDNFETQVTGQQATTQSVAGNGTYSLSAGLILIYNMQTGTSNSAQLNGNKFVVSSNTDLGSLRTEFTKQ